jgi:hypothetical protein
MDQYDIFVSYCRDHSSFAQSIFSLLSINGRVFLDSRSIHPEDKWENKILSALKQAEIVVLIWCCHAAERPWVLKEISQAESSQKKVIPVLLCNAPLGQFAHSFEWIDFRGQVLHECDCLSKNLPASQIKAPVISLEEWSLSLDLSLLDPEQLDVEWKNLIGRNRLGFIVKLDEIKMLSFVSVLTSFLVIAAANTPPLHTMATCIGIGSLAEVLLSFRRWHQYLGLEKLGMASSSIAKILALSVYRERKGIRGPTESKNPGPSGIIVGDGTIAGERNPQQCKTKSSINIS